MKNNINEKLFRLKIAKELTEKFKSELRGIVGLNYLDRICDKYLGLECEKCTCQKCEENKFFNKSGKCPGCNNCEDINDTPVICLVSGDKI